MSGNPGPVGTVLNLVLLFFIILLIIRLVLDYIQMFARSWRPSGFVLVLAEVVFSITDPPLKAMRRLIPPLRIGSLTLDLSFLVVIVLAQIARGLTGLIPF